MSSVTAESGAPANVTVTGSPSTFSEVRMVNFSPALRLSNAPCRKVKASTEVAIVVLNTASFPTVTDPPKYDALPERANEAVTGVPAEVYCEVTTTDPRKSYEFPLKSKANG